MSILKSLDDIERAIYNPAPSPMDSTPVPVTLKEGAVEHALAPASILLDGTWDMAEGGNADRIYGEWEDCIPAQVPGSVHLALMDAGRIPDPTVGLNDAIAREQSFKTWWFKRKFPRPKGMVNEKLIFEGVCESCTVWLNGQLLGAHKGMFGGPEFNISRLLKDDNVLVVRINPVPPPANPADWTSGWRNTVVFNCVYGWHYARIPALGIWRSVRIEGSPSVAIKNPFIAARDAKEGVVDLCVKLEGDCRGWSGVLIGTIEPDNFLGKTYHFTYPVNCSTSVQDIHLRFIIPEPRLWWPVDLGEQNLYRLRISFLPESGGVPDYKEMVFGIRTIEMHPLPGGPYEDKYNWTFVINGKAVFLKGANWCTLDALMRFDRARYDRFLTLARNQHIQLLRAWGGGMPETEEFYDLCNRKGIMVYQEWPTAWDSQKVQPADVLRDTIVRNIFRLRNHPSLIMWGGGNESPHPTDAVMDMIGRLCYELDGTRPFHRSDPWGGNLHNYDVYWGWQPLERNLSLTSCFIGEFGLASAPNYESVQRYLPEYEKDVWPAPEGGSFEHHTPVFNTREDMKRLSHYVGDFVANDSMENFILGTQMAQATGIRHTLELARIRWPEATGVCYYKLTDVYPGCSWSSIDWYGVPKLGYYIFQDSYQPLHACVIFSKLNFVGEEVSLRVYLLDDSDELAEKSWKVIVRAYDSRLDEVKRGEYSGNGSINRVANVGSFTLSEEQTRTTPLLVVAEVEVNGELRDRTFYWANYQEERGCLFNLPKTQLSMVIEGNNIVVKNTGNKPAVAVHFDCSAISEVLIVEDNFFWLDPGEEKSIAANRTDVAGVKAWNVG